MHWCGEHDIAGERLGADASRVTRQDVVMRNFLGWVPFLLFVVLAGAGSVAGILASRG